MNVFLEIGGGIEIAAKDAVDFTDRLLADARLEAKQALTPRALIALAILVAAVGEAALEGAAAAAQDGLNFSLDATTVLDLQKCYPDAVAWINSLAIHPPAQPAPSAPDGVLP